MLCNFAAGAFMLVLRPFKVGDFVQMGAIARRKAAVSQIMKTMAA